MTEPARLWSGTNGSRASARLGDAAAVHLPRRRRVRRRLAGTVRPPTAVRVAHVEGLRPGAPGALVAALLVGGGCRRRRP